MNKKYKLMTKDGTYITGDHYKDNYGLTPNELDIVSGSRITNKLTGEAQTGSWQYQNGIWGRIL